MSFERRKGYGVRHLDRRRTYIDIMERVLGTGTLSQRSRQRGSFARQVNLVTPPFAAAVASVEVRVLDSIDEPA